MADKFSHEMLIKVVAEICQVIGFDKIMTSVLYTLSDILGAFLTNLGRVAQRYSEHSGRTHINERDLSLAFHDFNIIPSELVDFLEHVSPLPEPLSLPKYPVATSSQLSFQEPLSVPEYPVATSSQLSFHNIIPSELVDCLERVGPLPEPLSVPKYPVATSSQLSFQNIIPSELDCLERVGPLPEPLNLSKYPVATSSQLSFEEGSSEKVIEVQSQLRENLKIKISLKKIREASELNTVKFKKSKKRKKNKENRKGK